jgi:2-C-methyl-D-erythritol 4-phosphate cytidylyltransferase / 2-C-methyl-D-erythritol 2,4-cyclodiphosphate synthase
MHHLALIPAAGVGQRFNAATGSQLPKQYALLAGQPMLLHTVQALLNFEVLAQIWVVVSPNDAYAFDCLQSLLQQHPSRLKLSFSGGDTRSATVRNGLHQLVQAGYADDTWVWVHDAARPAIALKQLQKLQEALQTSVVGALLATPIADTLKSCAQEGQLTLSLGTLSRQSLWHAQTPQCFGLAALAQALDAASTANYELTDESSAIEFMRKSPVIVLGSTHNFKVTHPEDAALMTAVLTMDNGLKTAAVFPKIAIGEGMDVHALVAGRPLILGGVTIPHAKGLQGHSDADALLHAITDALLGAAGMGDIGRLFPDTDQQYKGADSQMLLKHAYEKVAQAGWVVNNVDATIVAQSPKMAPHIVAMQMNIAVCLQIAPSQVNIKAKTNEKLGWLGREEGIETRAVVLLQAQ